MCENVPGSTTYNSKKAKQNKETGNNPNAHLALERMNKSWDIYPMEHCAPYGNVNKWFWTTCDNMDVPHAKS